MTRAELESIAAQVRALGVCSQSPDVSFGVSDHAVAALTALGAYRRTDVYREPGRPPYVIEGAALMAAGVRFHAQSPVRAATPEEIAALDGATVRATVSATVRA